MIAGIAACASAGFDHVGIHQIGPDQNGFFEFWQRELRPALEREAVLSASR